MRVGNAIPRGGGSMGQKERGLGLDGTDKKGTRMGQTKRAVGLDGIEKEGGCWI